ncbi:MAG: restriction endonuclease subunit S [Oscillospiraceae bacterium]|nr:restriction endonuclease subunit S [Oscillospiraceae bacterium]
MTKTLLQDVCVFIVDCPHSTAQDQGEGYPLIRTPNIGKGRLILEGVHRVSESVYKQRIARGVPQDGDLIFAREAPAGNVAIVKNGDKVCLGQRTVLLRPNKEKVVPEYLVYYLLAPQQQYGLLGTANGATVAHVNLPTIRELPIELPPMDIQRRIADILSAYDDLIENNQKQIKLLEEAAQRLYREWFVELRFPGHETTPVVDGVPEGWERTTFGAICSLRKETLTPERIPEGIPYIGLEHMPRRSICLSEWGDSGDVNSNKFMYYENDVLFGKIRPYFHKVGFALNSGVASTDSIVMIAKDGVWGLLLTTASSDAFVDYTYQNCKEGAKMPRADWSTMQKYKVLIAEESVQQRFEAQIRAIADRIKSLAMQNRLLAEARDRLLPKLMSGEMEVC